MSSVVLIRRIAVGSHLHFTYFTTPWHSFMRVWHIHAHKTVYLLDTSMYYFYTYFKSNQLCYIAYSVLCVHCILYTLYTHELNGNLRYGNGTQNSVDYTHHDQKFQKQGNIVRRYFVVFYAVILMECRKTTLKRFLFFWATVLLYRTVRSLHSERAHNNIFDGATYKSRQPPTN